MISFLIDFNVSECDAGDSKPKVGKSENSPEGSYGWSLTHSWRTV